MTLLILLGAWFLWFVLEEIVKDTHAKAKQRRDNLVMAAWQRQESARAHRWRLEEIEARRRAATEEMIRAAVQAEGEVVEGRAEEIEPR